MNLLDPFSTDDFRLAIFYHPLMVAFYIMKEIEERIAFAFFVIKWENDRSVSGGIGDCAFISDIDES